MGVCLFLRLVLSVIAQTGFVLCPPVLVSWVLRLQMCATDACLKQSILFLFLTWSINRALPESFQRTFFPPLFTLHPDHCSIKTEQNLLWGTDTAHRPTNWHRYRDRFTTELSGRPRFRLKRQIRSGANRKHEGGSSNPGSLKLNDTKGEVRCFYFLPCMTSTDYQPLGVLSIHSN